MSDIPSDTIYLKQKLQKCMFCGGAADCGRIACDQCASKGYVLQIGCIVLQAPINLSAPSHEAREMDEERF